jgi:hypothetical protein
MYNYCTNLIASNQMIVMAIFFLIILIFGEWKHKLHSLFSFTSCVLAYAVSYDSSIVLTYAQYTDDLEISILWDSGMALIMTAIFTFDKLASKQAKLLAFAVICHIVILWHYEKTPSFLSFIFYYWYDELIIAIGFLQMMVSKNGFTGAFSELQSLLFGFVFRGYCLCKGLLARKKRARKF